MFPSRVFLCSEMTLVKGVDLYHRVMQEFFLRSVFPLMHLLILVWGDSSSSFSLFTKVIENKHAKATHNDISRITNPPPFSPALQINVIIYLSVTQNTSPKVLS